MPNTPTFRSRPFLPILALLGCQIMAIWGCGGSKALKSAEVSQFKLGEPMPDRADIQFEDTLVRDTVFAEGGYQWHAWVLKYPDGDLIVESDFFGHDLVNRIRIETPSLPVAKDLAVGQTFGDIQSAFKKVNLMYLSAYQLVDVVPKRQPQLHFLIKEPTLSPDQGGTLLNKHQISDSAQIVAIVVM
ncbi:hypothetical protein [Pontibacter sp. G13]|uniref:hypothetical protein n=1 Tax=Pontibacter sp. G13 TaxID=3074898 RepID=UPI00288B8F49|nr:hypothetical protein [Pontibacter sp. G13]WNJ21119.1 hypothetical protein RJD25_11675 [Pontibacter sp. G13]